MSELASALDDAYTRDRFPYAGILQDLTDTTIENQMGPVQAYATFLDLRDQRVRDPHYMYGSSAITTGGHAHYMDNAREIVQANTRTAQRIATLLDYQGAILGRRLRLSVDLGYTGWTQDQYMTHWCLQIAGLDVREFAKQDMQGLSNFEATIGHTVGEFGTDLEVMNNSKLDRETRSREYARHILAMAHVVKHADVSSLPAYGIVQMVDGKHSLGTFFEKEYGDEIGVPVSQVAAVKPATIADAVPAGFQRLREDLEVITAHGGEVIAERGSILTLVRAD
jgi:hypothetical protein